MDEIARNDRETAALRARAEKVLNWEEDASSRFSLRTLQSFVRGKDPELDAAFALHLDSGRHLWTRKGV